MNKSTISQNYEIWKPVSGFQKRYEVSNTGRIKSLRSGEIIKSCIDTWGYHQIHMSIQGKKVVRSLHREVAAQFIGKIYDQVDHIDGNKNNNCVSNLRLCTRRENMNFYYNKKHTGAFFDKSKGKWVVYLRANHKRVYIGRTDTPEEASALYLNAVAKLREGPT